MITQRVAHIVKLNKQPDMTYLVACGCPHEQPVGAPFYACMAGCGTSNGAFVRVAVCEFVQSSKCADDGVDTGPGDYIVECGYRTKDDAEKDRVIGNVGTPTVTHQAVAGDSDGGDCD